MTTENIYSIANGSYYVSSRDDFTLTIFNITLVLGFPISDLRPNNVYTSFVINNTKQFQYNPIKVNRGGTPAGYLTFDPNNKETKLTISKDNKNQNFCFTTDGRILLVSKDEKGEEQLITYFINNKSSLQVDTTRTRGIWRFSNYQPSNNMPSLWNPKITYNMQLNELEKYYNQGSGEDLGGCDREGCSCHTSRGAKCGDSQTLLFRDPGVFEDKAYCLKTKWDEKNKASCCAGDINVLKIDNEIPTNKLDYDKCKIVRQTKVCDKYFSDTDINNAINNTQPGQNNRKPGAWAPFTRDCKASSAVINFCSQQDTLNNSPLLL